MNLALRPNCLFLLLGTSLLCLPARDLRAVESQPSEHIAMPVAQQDPEANEPTHRDLHQALTADALANSTIVKDLEHDVSLRGEKAVFDAKRDTHLCLSGPSGYQSGWDTLPVGELSRQLIAFNVRF